MSGAGGYVRGGPLILLRLEGAVLLVAAILAYAHGGYSWWMFAELLLLPDVSMMGYLVNARVGAVSYNAAHTITSAAALAVVGFLLDSSLAQALAAIWFAHIGLDRMLGYGLKYMTGFADSHLGRLGRTAPPVTEAVASAADAALAHNPVINP